MRWFWQVWPSCSSTLHCLYTRSTLRIYLKNLECTGLINTDKTWCLIIHSVVYKLTCCSRSNRERREGSLISSCWSLTGRGIFSTGMRNLVNIIEGTPDGPVMNKCQYYKIDNLISNSKYLPITFTETTWVLEPNSPTATHVRFTGLSSPVTVMNSTGRDDGCWTFLLAITSSCCWRTWLHPSKIVYFQSKWTA